MEQACGPPPEMAEKRDELTPMMAQYHDLCARYDDAIVLFQVGDFYETFCGAAERTARLLELTLTSREDSTGEYPMTGVPVDSAASYIETLLEAGYRVAIADQVEEPGESPGVVERAVTRVITPGTITEDELLGGADNNFVAALSRVEGVVGLALLDVSTGDFLATSSESVEAIADELSRFDPAEVLVGPDAPTDLVPATCMETAFDDAAFDLERARAHLSTYYGSPDALLADDAEIGACGAVLAYAEYARGGTHEGSRGERGSGETDATAHAARLSHVPEEPALEYLTHLTRYDPREYLLLDAVAVRSLELFEPRAVHGQADATLIGVLDETASALGGRALRDWLRRPLLDPDRIAARHDAVEELTGAVRTRERCHDLLGAVYDLERLIGRISRERANARDLRALQDTLAVVPDLREALADADAPLLESLRDRLDPLTDVRTLIDEAIVEDPPIEITEGGVIAEGYDEGLDELRSTAREGKRWIDDLEARERERTGIDSLKVGSNAVHGYYIEVTNPNLDSVPDDYQRRQTLKNAERFVTPALKEREDEIVGAERRAQDREYERFCEVRRDVAADVQRVQALAEAVATLDALVSLATVAAQYDYSRPDVLDPADAGNEPVVRIEGGRHPVVERTQESFVPNGTTLGGAAPVPGSRIDSVGTSEPLGGSEDAANQKRASGHANADRRLAIITGPNMSGKSTYMRQVAQIVLLAQVGSFVPARAATLTPVERIFTRVGASDDIAGGRSTFMVEMDELATILEAADERSLVILDEVGRGTSTADGLAIARATVEYLHDEVGALTLFATHHHPVTALADELEAAFALHFETSHDDGEVVFHHEIAPGAADGSYGVEVATTAGVPDPVVDRARELVDSPVPTVRSPAPGTDAQSPEPADGRADDDRIPARSRADGGAEPSALAVELRSIDIAHLTPVEALAELDRLQRLLEE